MISERVFEDAIEATLLWRSPDEIAAGGAEMREGPEPLVTTGCSRAVTADVARKTTIEQMMDKLDGDAALDAAARVNTRDNVRLAFDHKVDQVIQEIVDNFDLYKRITDDRPFGEVIKNLLFDQYLRSHRSADELIRQGESKTLEFKSTLRWNLKENRKDDQRITHAALKTIAAFLNTEGGDLLLGVADDGTISGIERDRLDNDDKFMLHLAQVVRNGLGNRAGTCIDPKIQRHGRLRGELPAQPRAGLPQVEGRGDGAGRRLLRPQRPRHRKTVVKRVLT